MTIHGPTAVGASVTVQRGVIANFRIFNIANTATVTINKLTIANGATTATDQHGGGIKVSGKLTLNDCVVQNNNAVGDGGGIFIGSQGAGELTLKNTKVLNNQANGFGGGIYISLSKVFIHDKSDVSNNTSFQRGGGIYFVGVNNPGAWRLKLDDSTVTNNTATQRGGGISAEWFVGVPAAVNIVEVTKTKIDNNRSVNGDSGGYYNGANTTMDNQTSVSFNRSGDRKGEGIVVRQGTKLTAIGTKVQNNQHFPPPGGGEGLIDDGLPFAVYIEDGAELILQGVEISGNDGHGVFGHVISLGNNYVENSLTTSSGWIASDIVT